jgi:hypothetical protein
MVDLHTFCCLNMKYPKRGVRTRCELASRVGAGTSNETRLGGGNRAVGDARFQGREKSDDHFG